MTYTTCIKCIFIFIFRVAAICISEHIRSACVHEFHIFGTTDHTVAIGKIALLVLILFSNVSNVHYTYTKVIYLFIYCQFLQQKLISNFDGYFVFWCMEAYKLNKILSLFILPCSSSEPQGMATLEVFLVLSSNVFLIGN